MNQEEFKNKAIEAAKTLGTKWQVTYMAKGRKQLYIISRPKSINRKNKFAVKSLINHSYQFLYDPKHDMLAYNNGFKRKEMKVYDSNWGNVVSAMDSLSSFDWCIKNPEAKRVMKNDSVNFYEMQAVLNLVKMFLQKKAQGKA